MHPVFLLTAAYFVLGAAALKMVDRRAGGREKAERWTKFAVYFVIVHAVLLAILARAPLFAALAAVVVAVGLFELLRTGAARGRDGLPTLAAALPLYALVGYSFLGFARTVSTPMLLFVYVVVLTFDGFSEIAGRLLGRHKLAPRVSPGKTVEGLAGGLTMAAVTALPLSAWSGVGRTEALALAIVIAASALAGDLAASSVKRASHVKDFGTWIPGHGGVLDRFDSFIVAGGAYWWLASRP
jgi:phosphatidate cytidylyltransferase